MEQVVLKDDVKTNRHLYIGGSDIAAVMGMSRWKTPLKLWAEKTQKIAAADLSSVEAVELGADLEEFVAWKFTQKTGKAVRRAGKVYSHPDYPYMVAHIDRLVTGTDELLECKTCSAFKKDEWNNEDIPQEYILQVMWYLGITGRKVGYIAVLIGGQAFKYKQIEFDQEMFASMVEAAKEFWRHVEDKTPVMVMAADDDTLKELYPEQTDTFIELFPTDDKKAEITQNFEDNIAHLQELKGQKKDIEEEIKQKEAVIKDIIKDNLGIKTPKYKVTWKLQHSTSVDKEAMKNDGVFEKYAMQNSFRVLRVAANKESEVA